MANQADASAARLGLSAGQVVQEFGWDDDVDDDLRAAIEGVCGSELADEDYGDVADAVVIWWREGDGDLTDMLVDALNMLDDGGAVWVFTPKSGRVGEVGHNDIEEAATTAGLHAMNTFSVAPDWTATRLSNRGRGK
jgi:hypothetical protein